MQARKQLAGTGHLSSIQDPGDRAVSEVILWTGDKRRATRLPVRRNPFLGFQWRTIAPASPGVTRQAEELPANGLIFRRPG